jgi:hypothetical protein
MKKINKKSSFNEVKAYKDSSCGCGCTCACRLTSLPSATAASNANESTYSGAGE